MAKKKRKDTPAQQSKRFIDMARELGVDESEAGQDRAFGKVGINKPREHKPKKRKAAR